MNLIVICTDTFRADYLGCYGNTWMETPHLDSFARESIVYDSCWGESLPTVQARRIWFTGHSIMPFSKAPQPKGVFPDLPGWRPLNDDDDSLAEILRERGYYTGLVTDLWHYFKPNMNLHRGFANWQFIRGQEQDPWRTGPDWKYDPREHLPEHLWTKFYHQRTVQYLKNTAGFHSEEDYFAARTFRTAARWLEDNVDKQPFFLWADTFDPHEPFDCPQHYARKYCDDYPVERYIWGYGADHRKATPDDVRHIRGVYCGLCTLVDRWAGHLLETIRRLGLLENSLVVFTSDHGTEFMEHGHLQKHPHLLHHQVVRLPLIVHHPDSALNGRRIDGLVSALDFMPTFLNFLGEEGAGDLDGEDFLRLATGETQVIHEYVYSGYGRYGSVRDKEWNYIFPVEGEPEEKPPIDEEAMPPDLITALLEPLHPPRLYHYGGADFDETENIIDRYPEVAAQMRERALQKWPEAPL